MVEQAEDIGCYTGVGAGGEEGVERYPRAFPVRDGAARSVEVNHVREDAGDSHSYDEEAALAQFLRCRDGNVFAAYANGAATQAGLQCVECPKYPPQP